MNQALKNDVYQLGTDETAEFVAVCAGLNQVEHDIFMAWHRGDGDLDVMADNGLTETSYKPIERRIRTKVAIAVFDCINFKKMYLEKI